LSYTGEEACRRDLQFYKNFLNRVNPEPNADKPSS